MKIALGTVQFGVNYGISNKVGKTSKAEVSAILETARNYGVSVIDTASLYGDSEEVLGQSLPANSGFKIVTKTPKFVGQMLNESDAQNLEDFLLASLRKLGAESIYGLLIHQADDLMRSGADLLVKKLQMLKQSGLVRKIGVSVYSGQQIDRVLDQFPIDLIQLPVSVLDQRLLQTGHLQKLKRAGVEIHARSVFLQGALLMEQNQIPCYFDSARGIIEAYHRYIEKQGLTPVQAALGFVTGIPEIDRVICGVNDVSQLCEICDAAQTTVDVRAFAEFAVMEEAIVNPALWNIDK